MVDVFGLFGSAQITEKFYMVFDKSCFAGKPAVIQQ